MMSSPSLEDNVGESSAEASSLEEVALAPNKSSADESAHTGSDNEHMMSEGHGDIDSPAEDGGDENSDTSDVVDNFFIFSTKRFSNGDAVLSRCDVSAMINTNRGNGGHSMFALEAADYRTGERNPQVQVLASLHDVLYFSLLSQYIEHQHGDNPDVWPSSTDSRLHYPYANSTLPWDEQRFGYIENHLRHCMSTCHGHCGSTKSRGTWIVSKRPPSHPRKAVHQPGDCWYLSIFERIPIPCVFFDVSRGGLIVDGTGVIKPEGFYITGTVDRSKYHCV